MLFNAYELEQHTRQRLAAIDQQVARQALLRQTPAPEAKTPRLTPGWLRRKPVIR